MIAMTLLWTSSFALQPDDVWAKLGPDGRIHVQLYFFWSLICPHCLEAPERLNNLAVAFGLLGVALFVTWIAARLTREKSRPDG